MKIKDVELRWLGHAGFLINAHGKVIYIDPYNIKEGLPAADIIFLTHSHSDHCSLPDLMKVIKEGTKIVAPADCQSTITKLETSVDIELVEPEMEFQLGNVKVDVMPSYNINKHFHSKEEGWVGYVIKLDGVVIYHSGDTDVIPEMEKLTGYKQPGKEFVVLLPVGGRYTMNAEEAAEAAKTIKPTLAIPMHWGSVIGSETDANEFVKLCSEEGLRAEILEKE